MLEEAVNVIRQLWTGEEITHRGDHYTVQGARLYTVPEQQAEIYLAASKPQRGRRGVRGSGRERKPKLGMIHIAYDEDEEAGHERAHRLWPNLALAGSGGQELPAPRNFEESAANVTVADVAESTPAGPDPEPYLELIRKYEEAGFTHVYIHQIGDNQ